MKISSLLNEVIEVIKIIGHLIIGMMEIVEIFAWLCSRNHLIAKKHERICPSN
jgi:hypothetical protein